MQFLSHGFANHMQILHSWVNLHLIRTMCKLNFAYIEFCSNIKEVSSPPTFRWRHYKKIAMATSFLTCNVFGAVAKHFPTFHKILRNFSSFLKKNPHTTAVSFVFTDIKYDSVLSTSGLDLYNSFFDSEISKI